MQTAREFLKKAANGEGSDLVSRLNIEPPRSLADPSFFEYFVLRGIQVDRVQVQPNSVVCSFKVPRRLADGNGNLSVGAIAVLVDEIGDAVIHRDGLPMDVTIDMSISYLSTAKINDELEISSRLLGQKGGYLGTHVVVQNKSTGEIVAEGRSSFFRKPASKM